MGIEANQERIRERKDISLGILWWMSEQGLTLAKLAYRMSRMRRSKDYIKSVIAVEPVEIEVDFLRDCVLAFGLPIGRTTDYEETVKNLSWGECVELLTASLAVPPRQGHLWD